MPSLNSLRTKGGVIVTIVIFLALIAFIIGDLFSAGSSLFNSRKMRVGEINGNNIGYTEFLNRSDYVGSIYKMLWGRDAVDSEQQEMIYNTTWSQLIMENAYEPSLKNMGMMVSTDEQTDMVNGTYLSPVISQTFVNPSTGAFDPQFLRSFMASAREDDTAYAIWEFLKDQMVSDRVMSKYSALVTGGMYVTDMEVNKALAAANYSYDADIVAKTYRSVADSLVSVTDDQIRKYYNSHKELYRQGEARDVEYVVFDMLPSEDDYAQAQRNIDEIATEFETAENPMQYAMLNSQVQPDQRYYKESELSPRLATVAFGSRAGEMFGPELAGDTYTISRLADIKSNPDSLGAKHILLSADQQVLADSLVGVLRQNPSNFESVAAEYSMDRSVVQNGGDLGRFSPEDMIPEFTEALVRERVGNIFSVTSQVGIHVVQLTYKASNVRRAQVATITYRVDPSDATNKNIYDRASAFLASAQGTQEGFNNTVNEESLSKRTIRISNTDRTIPGLNNSKELIRWAFTEKRGTVSPIMDIDGDYVVAVITGVREQGYAPVEQVASSIRPVLMNQAKARYIIDNMQGSSLEEIATSWNSEIENLSGINAGGVIPGFGSEPKLSGAIAGATVGEVAGPVEGNSAVYALVVRSAENSGTATAEDIRARLEAESFYAIYRMSNTLMEESDIKDMRVKFF